ncbi:hypothetical protein ABL78_7364 [Leptomonas seymouri]|uniref:Uncharacterized protein n=1 Tax=Leptomonas seymouri TaxID=5684 RepID=A0A0N1PBG5_LEPSE|nr:hypothetical protein ABL78_7364 [Leptomonas seymouri]|eukprot:KPI83591.1 hypothetical protein ABL78_7364 [Leptomonas seymouri]
MEESVFRRPYDLSDEATTFGYSDAELFDATPLARANPSTTHSTAVQAAAARLQPGVRAGPLKRDLMAMRRVMKMTSTLQSEQDAREAQVRAQAETEAERLRRERNAKWEAVKARMSARPTPLHTVRAYDSDWSDSEEDDRVDGSGDVQSIRSTRSELSSAVAAGKRTALDALVPTLAEERAVRAGPLYTVESVPQRFCHFIYNWWMFFVHAISVSLMPGLEPQKAADPKEYYSRKRYA